MTTPRPTPCAVERHAIPHLATAMLALMAPGLVGCTPNEVEPDPVGCSTDDCEPPEPPPGDDGGDETGGEPQRVCSVFPGDDQVVEGTTVRWLCSGFAEANVKVALNIETDLIDQATLDAVESPGLTFNFPFGPQFGASPEDDAVVACCEHDYDYPFTPQPELESAEHGWACAKDCIDQACRAVPDAIRDLAEEHKAALLVAPSPCGLPGASGTPCAYWQLWDLSNFIADHQQDCFDAFNMPASPPFSHQIWGHGGELDLDAFIAANDPGADAAWPSLDNIIIKGKCGIEGETLDEPVGWELTPPPLQPCTDSNDNNEEDPFEAHGAGFWGPDTFVASSGQVQLDGPSIFGANADGVAPLEGSSNTDCESETCTWFSMSMRNDIVRLHDLNVVVPQNLSFTQNDHTLLLDDFRLHVDHPETTALVRGTTTHTFAFATGSVKAIASGKIYGVPVFRQVWNSTPLQGTLREGRAGTYNVTISPAEFDFTDGFGNRWVLSATFNGWVANRRAPRADFEIQHIDTFAYLDATTSSDGDGDELLYTWYVDGVEAGSTAVLRVPWDPNAIHVVVLHVLDSTGRDDWAVQLRQTDV